MIQAKTSPQAIFRETFNDEQTTRANGGTPTDITFNKGVGEFDGSTSELKYPSINTNEITIVLKGDLSVLEDNAYIVQRSDTAYLVYYNADTFYLSGNAVKSLSLDPSGANEIIITSNASSTKIYKNGVCEGSTSGTINFTFTGFSIRSDRRAKMDLSLFELYDYAMTEEEVDNYHNNKTYHDLNIDYAFNLETRNGAVDDSNSIIVSNTVDIIKTSTYAIFTDAINTKDLYIDKDEIDVDSDDNFTIGCWHKAISYATNYNGVMSNIDSVAKNGFNLNVSSIGNYEALIGAGGTWSSIKSSVKAGNDKYFFVALKKDGNDFSFFVDGELKATKTTTMVSPTSNLAFGRYYKNSTGASGTSYIGNPFLANEALSDEEITQIYTSQKRFYK